MERIDSKNLKRATWLLEEPAPPSSRRIILRRSTRSKRSWMDDAIHTLRSSQSTIAASSCSFDPFGGTPSEDFIDKDVPSEDKQALLESLQRLDELFPHDSYQLPVDFPKFRHDELVLGKKLGEGSFSHVHDVLALNTTSCSNDTTSPSSKEIMMTCSVSRAFCASRARDEQENLRYALKQLKSSTESSWSARVDLVVETRILSLMVHPHIIKVRAVAKGNPLGDGYFILLDRLYGTMDQRLEMDKQRIANTKRCFMPNKEENEIWFQQQLEYAYDLSTALEYLHDKRIIHRDIKPTNVGFDLHGVVKLVDFGFARQLPDQPDTEDGRYLLSGMTGSVRYMSPEVYKDLPYTETCDTYSFAVMVWEMLTLNKPYDNMGTLDRLVQRVFERGQRPRIPSAWPLVLRKLMKKGWEHDAAKRADMGTIARMMKTLVGDVRDGCESVDTISVNSQGETRNKSSGQAMDLVRRYSSRVFEFSREMTPILRVSSGFNQQVTGHNSDTLTCIAEDS